MLKSITGFVIKTQNYRDTHKLITLFTKELGKVTAIARGANKPNSRMVAITQPFVYGNFLTYISSGLSTIQQGEVEDSNRRIREDIIKTTYASYISELTWKTLRDREANSYLYRQLKHTMKWISDHDESMIPMMMYELKIYKIAGISPVIDSCVLCQTHKELEAFSIAEGGLVCQKCRNRDPHSVYLTPTLIKLLQMFNNVGIDQVGNISIKKSNEQTLRFILDEYYDRYGGYPLKTRKVLNQLDLL